MTMFYLKGAGSPAVWDTFSTASFAE
jgi:hypothetical protein